MSLTNDELTELVRTIVTICEKNTKDMTKVISTIDKLTLAVSRLQEIQLAQSRDIAKLTDIIYRNDL